jgi:hypothetical protein
LFRQSLEAQPEPRIVNNQDFHDPFLHSALLLLLPFLLLVRALFLILLRSDLSAKEIFNHQGH